MIDPTKISRDLAEIIDLEGQLLAQAVHSANAQVDGHSLPGGRAMVSLAPVGRLSTWTDRVFDAERRWREDHPDTHAKDRPDWGADEDDSWEPALQTLRYWSDHYRKILGMQWDIIPTLGTEARFLRHETVLPWIVDHEPHFDWFADDINQARRRLEDVVNAGTRQERTRVVCNHCPDAPQLLKVYADRKVQAYSCLVCDTPVGLDDELGHCPNPRCWTVAPPAPTWTSDPENDYWKCPRCKHRYDADSLRRAHAQQLRHESAARYVNWEEARATLVAQGRSERTVRKWMQPPLQHDQDRCTVCGSKWPPSEYPACPQPLDDGETCGGFLTPVYRGDSDAVVTSYCETETHRVMVFWPDLWRLHLTTPTRRRTAAS